MQAEQVQHVNDALLQLTKELAADVDVASLAATVTSRLKWLLHAATVNFFLVDKSTESLVWLQPMSEPGAAEAIVAPVKFPMKHGLVGLVASEGDALIMEKAFKHPKFDYTIDQCNVVPPGVDSSGSPQPGSAGLRDLHGTAQDSRIPSTPPATSRSSSTDASLPALGGQLRSGSLSMMRSTSSSDMNLPQMRQGVPLSLSLSTAPTSAKIRRKSALANSLGASDQPASALPTGVNVLSCLIVPVKDSEGQVVAVIQAVNKTLGGATSSKGQASSSDSQQRRSNAYGGHWAGDSTPVPTEQEGKPLRQRFTEPNLLAAVPRPGTSPVVIKRGQQSTPSGNSTSPLPGGCRRQRSRTETSDVMLVTSTTSNRSAMASPRRQRFAAGGDGAVVSPSSTVGSGSLLPSSPQADSPNHVLRILSNQDSGVFAGSADRLLLLTGRAESLDSDSSLLDADVRGVVPYIQGGTGINLPSSHAPPHNSPLQPPHAASAWGADHPMERKGSNSSGVPVRRVQSAGDKDGVVGAWGLLPASEHLRNSVIPFTASDASVAEGVSASVGVCLQKALMFEAISQAQRQTAAMLDIVKATSEERDIAQLMRRMVGAVFRALEADRVTLFLADHAAKELWVLVSRGDVDGVRVPMSRGIVGHVATTGVMFAVRDAYRCELFNGDIDRSTGYHTKSVLCMPVVDDRGHVVAVVEALNKLSPFEKARRAATDSKDTFRLEQYDEAQAGAPPSARSASRQNSLNAGSAPRARSGDSSATPRFRVLSPSQSGKPAGRRLTRGRSATASDIGVAMRQEGLLGGLGLGLLPASASHDTDGSDARAAAMGLVRSPLASPTPSPSGSSAGSTVLGDAPTSRPRVRRTSGSGPARHASFASPSASPSASPPPSPVMQALSRLVPAGGTRLGSSLHATVASASAGSGPRAGAVSPPTPPPLEEDMGLSAVRPMYLPSRPPSSPSKSQSEGASGKGGLFAPSSPFAALSVHTGGDCSPVPPPRSMRKQNSAPMMVPKGGMGRVVSPPAPPPRPEDSTPTPGGSTSQNSLKAHVEKSSAFVEFSVQDIQVLEACCAEMVQSLAQHSLRMLAQKRSRDGGMLAPAQGASPVHGRVKRMSRTSSNGSMASGSHAGESPAGCSQGSGGDVVPLLDLAPEQRGMGFVDSAVEAKAGSGPMSQSQMHNAMSSFLSSYMTSVEGDVSGAAAGTPAPTTPAFRPTSRRASMANVRSFRSGHKRSNTMQAPVSGATSAAAGGVGGFAADSPPWSARGSGQPAADPSMLKRSVSARTRGGDGGLLLSRSGSCASMSKLSTTSASSATSDMSSTSAGVASTSGNGGTHSIAHGLSSRTMTTAASFTTASVGVLEEEDEGASPDAGESVVACRRTGVSWNDMAANGTGALETVARVRSLAGLDEEPVSNEGGDTLAVKGIPEESDESPMAGMRVTLQDARDELKQKRPLPSPLQFERAATSTSTAPGPPTVPGPPGNFNFENMAVNTSDSVSSPMPAAGDDEEIDDADRYPSGNASVTLQHHDVADVHDFNPATDVFSRSPGDTTPRATSSDAAGNCSPVALARGGGSSALHTLNELCSEPAALGGVDLEKGTQHVPGVPVTVLPLVVGAADAIAVLGTDEGAHTEAGSDGHSLMSAGSNSSQGGRASVTVHAELGAYIPAALTSERCQLVLMPVPTMEAVHAAVTADISDEQLDRRIQRVLNQGSSVRFPVPGAPAPMVVSAWCDAVMNGNLPDIDTWAFRPWDIPMDLMPVVFTQMVFRLNLFTELPGLRMEVVASFAAACLAGYNSANEFHNMCHGLHVAQATYLLLRETGTFTALPPDEVLTLIVSALGHDVDHTGTNSAFLISSGSNLATRYNDSSVLENYHCASLSAILAVEDFAVFDFASPKRQRRLRSLMLSCIMCTDMSRHLEVVNSIQKLKGPLTHPALDLPMADIVLENGEVVFEVGSVAECPQVAVLRDAEGTGEEASTQLSAADGCQESVEHLLTREDFVCQDEQQRTDLCGILLHCADISGQVTPWSTATNWSDCVLAEFKAQAAMEVELELEATTFMHSLSRPEGAGTLQKGFCDFVLHDLFSAMGDLYPALRFRVQQLQANAARHGDIAEKARKAAMTASGAGEAAAQ